ncbi:MAG TPA: U32 family peptidase [Clostridiales bacterium]|nr:U32 family peptidase [Clostridiales bacterium]
MLELLAPAGNLETLKAALDKGADAVYVGGKQYHMRLLRDDFHFDDYTLRLAVETAHGAGKKLYVTVNSLIFEDELNALREYLLFLQELQVDALIVQDLGLLKVASELELTVARHSSVQMGANNAETLRALQAMGISRAVLSRNVTLAEIAAIHEQCDMELEYFIHGDACVSHEGQCRLSGFAAMSGNRGSCLKPCRWHYTLCDGESSGYLLAQKDLALIDAINDLAAAGVTSLKIEGRMRESAYIAHLVSVYREAIDRTAAKEELKEDLLRHRIRDFCSGGLYREIRRADMGTSGEREPGFVSKDHRFRTIDHMPPPKPPAPSGKKLPVPQLAVKVHDLKTLTAAAKAEAKALTVPLVPFYQHFFDWTEKALCEAASIAHGHGAKLRLELPLVLTEKNASYRQRYLKAQRACGGDAFIVHDLGSLSYFTRAGEVSLIAGEGLNLANHQAIAAALAAGAESAVLSTELCPVDLKDLVRNQPTEILIQGPLCGIVSDLCLLTDKVCPPEKRACKDKTLFLTDDIHQRYRIMTDCFCQSHLFTPFERCALAELPSIAAAGVKTVAIDATFYDAATTAAITEIYRNALAATANGKSMETMLNAIEELVKQPLAPLFAEK